MHATKPDKTQQRLARRTRRLLADLEAAGLVLSLVSGGGQAAAKIHPKTLFLEELHGNFSGHPIVDVGQCGIGDMLAL